MKKAALIVTVCIASITAVFFLGPKAAKPDLDPTPIRAEVGLEEIEGHLRSKESHHPSLKSSNEAGIVWAGDSVHRSEYAVVFLHGFSASKVEGRPVTTRFAEEFGMNLLEPRLYGHGLDTSDALIDLTPENYLNSAREAVALAKVIGEKVIVMSSSTGGTLSLYLAAHDPEIAAVICYSPNIEIFDPKAKLLTMPWGMLVARLVSGGDFRSYEASEEFQRYWQTRTRLEGALTVQSLIEATMTPETFARISQPVFVGCYYKNEAEQDKVVSVAAIRDMMPLLGTADFKKRLIEFPDAQAHVLTNPMRSQDVEGVLNETRKFAQEVLGIQPKVRQAQ